MDIPRFPPSTPSSPTNQCGSGGLGDLRNISRRGWSKSADDLSRISPSSFTPTKPSFQDRIVEYRSRSGSNASAASPSSPISQPNVINGRHPFPTVGSESPSSSPPRSATLPTLAISVSSPEEDGPLARTASPTHVHTRSHSFTPKLHSKLAPRHPPPPSPQRTNSNDREQEPRATEKMFGIPAKPAFGFGFGGPNPKSPSEVAAPNNRVTTLLPPPTIIEPGQHLEEPESMDPKRSSQIVFHSGFVNRLADVPANLNQGHLHLSKGWKPFKLELKGSKLYFYKPPSDRAASIKDLFPTTLVPPSEEDDEEHITESSTPVDDVDPGSARQRKVRDDGQTGTMSRKKRAYWGRRTHPDLIRNAATGVIEKGTFEALVHEAVFATTFFSEGGSEDRQEQKMIWHDFASSVVLSIPAIMGQQMFEAEFLRCCSYLVTGAEEAVQEEEKSRVAWLANEYLRYHGHPADTTGWAEWKKDTIPDATLSAEETTFAMSGLTYSASTQAVFQCSPHLGAASPNVNTFSPRPEDGTKMISLLDALFSTQYLDSRQGGRPALVPSNRYPWTALYEEGLTRDVLFHLDPHLIAKSLMLFHRSVLEQCPDNITAEFVMGSETLSSEEQEKALASTSFSASLHLFGSDDCPHWLTKLLLLQILGSDTSSGQHYPSSPGNQQIASPGRKSEDRGPQTSRTHSRSEVISVWAKVGELCRAGGDECSWRAIIAALCSRPIARLDKVWKRVDPQAVAAIESWVHVAADGESITVSEPQTTPWGGDVKQKMNEELSQARGEEGSTMIQMEGLGKAKTSFESFRSSFLLCPRRIQVSEHEISDDVRRMVVFWREMAAEGGGTGSTAVKFQRCVMPPSYRLPQLIVCVEWSSSCHCHWLLNHVERAYLSLTFGLDRHQHPRRHTPLSSLSCSPIPFQPLPLWIDPNSSGVALTVMLRICNICEV